MPRLVLKAKSTRSFDPKFLMALIDCLPLNQRPSIKELLNLYPEEIKLDLTSEVLESTIEKISARLGTVFDIQHS
ncbi:hypothetical protein HCY69_15645 [Acinetobacter radioresistens]|jgi:hypothetical protein|uniref:hypothetical protein n=1 Tax=Acinetobacter TaxID=469 RepID=UPI00135CDCDA|nr:MULTISPECIES: hypothetical protein [Acinetobacter]MCK4115579.1 hypothetical protein [Acinetobacter radioresistens]MCO8095502.1 hypothetical protein [Acinetobacter lwoffii]